MYKVWYECTKDVYVKTFIEKEKVDSFTDFLSTIGVSWYMSKF